jgi:hypothetical protein
MLNQVELRVDRTVENLSESFRAIGLCSWRLFVAAATLGSHNGVLLRLEIDRLCAEEEPLLCFEFQLRMNIHPYMFYSRGKSVLF